MLGLDLESISTTVVGSLFAILHGFRILSSLGTFHHYNEWHFENNRMEACERSVSKIV
jgi:hypothetical protein